MGVSAGKSSGGGMRRGRRRSHRSGAISEINITPMVDVMLVLLIIFMVAAPMLQPGIPVKLPQTEATALPVENEPPLTVTISADGKLYIMNTEVDRATFLPKLEAIAAERTSKKVFLRGDGDLSYAAVMEIMGVLNAAGYNDVGLVTDVAGAGAGNGG